VAAENMAADAAKRFEAVPWFWSTNMNWACRSPAPADGPAPSSARQDGAFILCHLKTTGHCRRQRHRQRQRHRPRHPPAGNADRQAGKTEEAALADPNTQLKGLLKGESHPAVAVARRHG